MEDLQVETRHSELLYWSVVEDASSNNLSVKKIINFRFESQSEIKLWESMSFAENSIKFYTFLEEVEKICVLSSISERRSLKRSGVSTERQKLLFSLRCAIIGYVGYYTTQDSVDELSALEIAGHTKLQAFNQMSKGIVEQIHRELYFSQPDFFVNDIFGAIKQSQSSSSMTKLSKMYPEYRDSLLELKDSGIFELFFKFSKKIKHHLIPHREASLNENEIIFFKDGPAWISDSLAGSLYSTIFSAYMPIEKKAILDFAQLFYLYMSQKDSTIKKTRSIFAGKIFEAFIKNKAGPASNFQGLATGLLANDSEDELNSFIADAYNNKLIETHMGDLKQIIHSELSVYKKKLYFLDVERAKELHKLVFINIIEKLCAFFSQNQNTALLSANISTDRKNEFTARLSDILRESYIDFLKGE